MYNMTVTQADSMETKSNFFFSCCAYNFAPVKKGLAIVVFISLFTQCIMQLGVIGWYELHKDYIAKTLCENRDKPQLKCCGKCYLRKQLNKLDGNNGTKNVPDKIEKSEPVVYILPSIITFSSLQSLSATVRTPVHQRMHSQQIANTIFHPPSACC